MRESHAEFAERLKLAMAEAGYEARPAVLERGFNLHWHGKPMTLHGVRRWLCGETIPSQDKLVALAEWLRVSPHHLRYGAVVAKRIEDKRTAWELAIHVTERDFIETYLALPAPERRAVREIVLALGRHPTGQTD